MSTPQIVQSLGFFWLAATGLLLSTESRAWDLHDFIGPVCGVLVYLVGRHWQRLHSPLHPWRVIMGIGILALLHLAWVISLTAYQPSPITLISLGFGGVVSIAFGFKLRSQARVNP